MTHEKEVSDMPIWQNHENRITIIEKNQDTLSHQMDGLEKVVKAESNEQKALLNKLIEHHLDTSKIKLSNFWKIIFNVTGAGGVLSIFIYALLQFLKLN